MTGPAAAACRRSTTRRWRARAGIRVTASGDGGATLFEKAATDGEDVETTLDPAVQEAAEKALADSNLKVPGAVVAVDVKSGEVLAVANSPTTGFDRALTGRYPPGSTFKVATSYAYLTRGITTPAAKVPCPASVTVDGREFTNFAGESVSGSPTFFQDFTISCNTAFVGLSGKLADDDLPTAAKALGIGAGLGRHARRQRHLRRQRAAPPPAAPTPRRRRSARAGSRSRRCRSR